MFIVGLTGGIASGKSTVAARLVTRGAIHIDADALSREVVEPGTPGLKAVSETFGEGVLSADGSLDRPALGAIVFGDPNARGQLEAIVHPLVHQRTAELLETARVNDPTAIVIYDVPLLVEARRELAFDLIVVCQAPIETRIARLLSTRGMPRDEAQRRIASQASDDERLAVADVVIDTAGTMEHTIEQVDELWADLVVRARDRASIS
ncbi:dephospho-CoA kinase [Agreia sp. COWG]|uniref:dephospho-CoA kinase n=1 Tax=Agreia sp. COWG TaxID=2773266 RepID=UPI001925CB41|nr:dephospho-CoA kinase [Agreia sp. COWG]CAD5998164.1 dephosphocoenzyme A kinase [Agreia sp. COWG]